MTTLAEIIATAHKADDAYQAAVRAAGYKSRWDVNLALLSAKAPRELQSAYVAKIEADAAMHLAFVEARKV
jgi:hypothetical protein